MSLAAQQSKVLIGEALIPEQALAAPYYAADDSATDLKSESQPDEIQY